MSKICNPQEIQEITKSRTGVFVLFYAAWCPFSMAFLPVYEKHAAGRDREFVRILLDGSEDLFKEHAIEVYPSVIYFENGQVSKRLDGKHLAGLKEKQLADLVASCDAMRRSQ
jgi:thioredoxin-like negative regulator of GroEL